MTPRVVLFAAVMLAGRAGAAPWGCATSYEDAFYILRAGACSTCYERMTASTYEEAVKHPAMRGATVWGARMYDRVTADNPCPRCGAEGTAVGVDRELQFQSVSGRLVWTENGTDEAGVIPIERCRTGRVRLVIRYVCRKRHSWTEKVVK